MRPRGYNLHLSGINLSLSLLLQYLLLLFLDFFFPSMFWVYIVQKPWQYSDSSLRAWYKAASNQSDHNGRWEIKVMSILQALGLLMSSKIEVHRLCTFWLHTRLEQDSAYDPPVSMNRKPRQVISNVHNLGCLVQGFAMHLPWSVNLHVGKELLAASSFGRKHHWVKPYNNCRLRPALKPTSWP